MRGILLLATMIVWIGLPMAARAYVVLACDQSDNRPAEGLKGQCGGPYNLCGYVDAETGHAVIGRNFEAVSRFSEGLGAVRVGGKYGFVDRSGQLVIAPAFALAGAFENGHAQVLVGDGVGLIDRSGKFVIEPKFAQIVSVGNQRAFVADGKWEAKVARGCEKLSVLAPSSHHVRKNKFRLLDFASGRTGNRLYEIAYFDDMRRGLVWAGRVGGVDATRFGLLRNDGKWVIEPAYFDVTAVQNGSANVCISTDRCGQVDKDGVLITRLKFPRGSEFRNGLALVRSMPLRGVMNENGQLLAGRYFDDARFVEGSDIVAVKSDGEWRGMNREGKLVDPPEETVKTCPSGVSLKRIGDQYRFVGSDGVATHSGLFAETYRGFDCGKPFSVQLGDKWGFIGSDGKPIGSIKHDNQSDFVGGFAGIQIAGKWGLMDISGRLTAPLVYDSLHPDYGAFAVAVGPRKFWIDGHGKEVPEPARTEDRKAVLACGVDGGQLVPDGPDARFWGLSDRDGKQIIEPRYRALKCFRNGLAWVADDTLKMWCQVDARMKIRDPGSCSASFNGVHIFDAGREEFDADPYESLVLWERALLDYGRGARKSPPKIIGGPVRF